MSKASFSARRRRWTWRSSTISASTTSCRSPIGITSTLAIWRSLYCSRCVRGSRWCRCWDCWPPSPPWAVLILSATVLPELLFRGRVSGRLYVMWNTQAPIRRLCHYLASLLADRGPAKEIRLWGLGASLLERFGGAQVDLYRQERRIAGVEIRGLSLFGVLSVAGTVAIWTWAAVDAVSGALALGTLVLVFQSAERARAQLQDAARGVGMLVQSRLMAQSYFDFLDLDPGEYAGSLRPAGRQVAAAAHRDPGNRPDRRVLRVSRDRTARSCGTSTFGCVPVSGWRSWARTGPARPLWSSCSRASTTPRPAASNWTASTTATTTSASCASSSGWRSRITRSFISPPARTSASAISIAWKTPARSWTPSAAPRRRRWSSGCRAGSTRCWAAHWQTARTCRAANGRSSRWRAPSLAPARC